MKISCSLKFKFFKAISEKVDIISKQYPIQKNIYRISPLVSEV